MDDYNPYNDVDLKDLLKAFYPGNNRVFTISLIKECFECGNQTVEDSSKELSLKCEKCSKLVYISMQIFPYDESLENFLKERQGYWLEWYIFRLLKDKFILEPGVKINDEYEADLIVIQNKKKIFIECKDTSDSPLINLYDIKKNFDCYILVSTGNYRKAYLENVKHIFKKKFSHITPDKIESITEIIEGIK